MRIICTILFLLFSLVQRTEACTSLLVTKGASQNGSSYITYAADSHTLYGELYHYTAKVHPKGAIRKVYEWDTGKQMGEIAEAAQTYTVNGNMNEWGLAIVESTYGGREELVDTLGRIDYGSLIYITLQRAKNAREAISIMVDLVQTYGYASSGESISIADGDEVWIFEIIGKGSRGNTPTGAVWVALRIPDGMVSAHANQSRIRTFPLADGKKSITSKQMNKLFQPEIEVVYAADIIDFAREKKYFTGAQAQFSFTDAFAPVDFGGARFCESRVWAFFRRVTEGMEAYQDYAMGRNLNNPMPLWVKPTQKISFKQIANAMRDHFEGTPLDMTKDVGAGPHQLPYRWRPMTWKYGDQNYVHERAVATQQTGFWLVAETRPTQASVLKGVLWFGVDDAATSCLTPIYSASTRVPRSYAVGNGDLLTYSESAAYWTFSRLTHFAYLRYDLIAPEIQKVQQQKEAEAELDLLANDAKVQALLLGNQDNEALSVLTSFSVLRANQLVTDWKALDRYLFVKYIDGNVKKEVDGKFRRTPYGLPDSPTQPQLPEQWRKRIVEDNGDVLKSSAASGH